MELLQIKKGNVVQLLAAFGKEVDGEGYIRDIKSKEIVKCRYTNHALTKKNLGGILPGSEIFIEDSDAAIAGYVMEFLSGENGN